MVSIVAKCNDCSSMLVSWVLIHSSGFCSLDYEALEDGCEPGELARLTARFDEPVAKGCSVTARQYTLCALRDHVWFLSLSS